MKPYQEAIKALTNEELLVEYRRVLIRELSESITKNGLTSLTYLAMNIILEEMCERFDLDKDYIFENMN